MDTCGPPLGWVIPLIPFTIMKDPQGGRPSPWCTQGAVMTKETNLGGLTTEQRRL